MRLFWVAGARAHVCARMCGCAMNMYGSSAAELGGASFEYNFVFKVILGQPVPCGLDISASLLPCLDVVPMGQWSSEVPPSTVHVCSVIQSCLTLCEPMDCSPPGSSVHGFFQGRILECVAIPYSRGSSQPRDWIHVSCISCAGRQILYPWATWEAPLHQLEDWRIQWQHCKWIN